MTWGSSWRRRIVGHGASPNALAANFRPLASAPEGAQQDAVQGGLDQMGWVQPVLVHRVTGHPVDGPSARGSQGDARGAD